MFSGKLGRQRRSASGFLIFKGNVLAATSITINTGAAVEGRMFAGAAGGAGLATVDRQYGTVPAP